MVYSYHANIFGEHFNPIVISLLNKANHMTVAVIDPWWAIIHDSFPRYSPEGYIMSSIFLTVVLLSFFLIFIRVFNIIFYYKFKNMDVSVSQHPPNKSNAFLTIRTAFQSVDSVLQFRDRLSFDNASSIFVLDNATNVHIINDLIFFINGITNCPEKCVGTIDGKDSTSSGIGLVVISLEDDDGNLLEIKLENAFVFPQSPVNIVSIACLADKYKDDEGTFIKNISFLIRISLEFRQIYQDNLPRE